MFSNRLGVIACTAAGATLVLASTACAQDPQEDLVGLIKQAIESQSGSVDINGRILSSDGMLLDGVTVDFYFRKAGDVLADAEIRDESLVADGSFHIKRRNVSSVNLWISKKGYYSEQWSFGFDEETERKNPGGYERIDVEIVLQEQPIPAPLIKSGGFLRSDDRGPISVVVTTRDSSGESWLRRNGEENSIEWPYFLLVPALDDNSEMPTKEFVVSGQRRKKIVLEKGWIRVANSKPGDGFIFYDPGPIPPKVENAMRTMNQAPETGYSQDLEISLTHSPEKVFFYCRFDGKYGKGMITGRPRVVVENDTEQVRALLLVFMNPTGSRNVSYLH